jgi:GntR family transcriptional regulator / MocR family aminotransferase
MEPVFPFDVNLATPGQHTLVQDLHRQLRAAILDGRMPTGFVLPSTRHAADQLEIARNTVVAAYDLLIAEGYVISRPGARAVVAALATPRPSKARRVARRVDDPRIQPAWRTPMLLEAPRSGLPERCFRLGIPEHRYFPHAIWRRLMARSLRSWSKAGFSYSPSQGIAELRAAIAGHVAFTRAVACSDEDIIVTSGAQQAFDLVARLLVTPGQTRVAVEEPGYPPLRAAFAAAGARLCPIPVDAEGLCVDHLPRDVRVISVTPSHQSPTGVAMSLRRRQALLEFARSHDAAIVEDDYDGEFRFGGRPLDALQTLDRDAQVFYVGTFSKSLFPALRKGFIVAPGWARDALIGIKQCTDAHCDSVTQSTLAAFIQEGHLARHVRRMRPIYAARRDALLDGLRRELGDWLEPIASEAGLHLAARILQPRQARRIIEHARLCTPGAQATDEYAAARLAHPALVFGYGVIDVGDIAATLKHLRRALER